jgi:transcription initiation factor IIE alpha subunit
VSTPHELAVFDQFENLESFLCICPVCAEEIEIFSDAFEKELSCPKCGEPIDFTKCILVGEGRAKEMT